MARPAEMAMAPALGVGLVTNAAGVLFPLYLIARLGRGAHPFVPTG